MKIIEKKLSEIKPYWRNPRKNEDTVIALTHSIHRYGFNVPLVIDKEGILITGHARYKALVKMHRETAPCVVMDAPPEQVQKFRILDNEIQDQSSWDMDKLMKEIEGMADYDEMMHSFKGSLDDVMSFMDEGIEEVDADVDDLLDDLKVEVHTIKLVECPYCGHQNPLDDSIRVTE